MSSFLSSFLVIGAVFGLGFILINLRYVVKGEEFRGTCASNNPMLKDAVGECSVCGKKPSEDCKMPEVK